MMDGHTASDEAAAASKMVANQGDGDDAALAPADRQAGTSPTEHLNHNRSSGGRPSFVSSQSNAQKLAWSDVVPLVMDQSQRATAESVLARMKPKREPRKSLLRRAISGFRHQLAAEHTKPRDMVSGKSSMNSTLDGHQIISVGSMVLLARPSVFRADDAWGRSPSTDGERQATLLGCFLRELQGCGGANCLSLNPEGNMLITGGSKKASHSTLSAETGWIQIWGMKPGTEIWGLCSTLAGEP